jgi:hypothetical protein
MHKVATYHNTEQMWRETPDDEVWAFKSKYREHENTPVSMRQLTTNVAY